MAPAPTRPANRVTLDLRAHRTVDLDADGNTESWPSQIRPFMRRLTEPSSGADAGLTSESAAVEPNGIGRG